MQKEIKLEKRVYLLENKLKWQEHSLNDIRSELSEIRLDLGQFKNRTNDQMLDLRKDLEGGFSLVHRSLAAQTRWTLIAILGAATVILAAIPVSIRFF